MRRVPLACALFVMALSPVFAQTTAPAGSNPTMPSNQPMPSTSQTQSQTMSPSQGNTTTADLTGQTIYSAKGKKIGTVSSMTTDARGQQAAAVTIGRNMGMGGQTVNVPVSSLQARANGGYTTNLSASELKSLSNSGASHMQ